METVAVNLPGKAFLRNAWYAVGFSDTVSAGAPTGVWVAGEPVVLFRRPGGEVAALEDRCSHRGAPLSCGRVEGDGLRCLYHGLRFSSDGQCVEIPGQAQVSTDMAVRAYAVVEREGWIWVWMGQADRAELALLPPALGSGSAGWSLGGGAMDYDVDYQLVNDNLCDFSHVSFVHLHSFGGSNEAQFRGYASTPPKIELLPRGIRVSRWLLDRAIPPFLAGQVAGSGIDSFVTYDYLVPGVLLMRTSMYACGTAKAAEDGRAPGEPLHENFTSQAVTPMDGRRTRYRFTWGPRTQDTKPGLTDAMVRLALKAFEEDKRIIEAQQRMLDASPGFHSRGIVHDKGLNLFRAKLAKMIAEENA